MHGGDINRVYALETSSSPLVVKLNHAEKFPEMFAKEAAGLNLLRSTDSFRIPEIIGYGQVGNYAYLLLEMIETGAKRRNFTEDFAQNLNKLHRHSSRVFGLEYDNYIGSLTQYNFSRLTKAVDFYIEKRLEPQFESAAAKGFSFKQKDSLYRNLEGIIPDEPPALIHGDLWGGNYLTSTDSEPVLIDPAVAYAPREMDLAMMRLFGGFEEEIFTVYNELFPLEKNFSERIKIWKLYYLLVHLNLFGSGYYNSVRNIVESFS